MTDWADTNPAIRSIQIDLMRKAPAWRKIEMLEQMDQTVMSLAEHGLDQRYPEDSAEILRHRLADLVLGAELAQKVYGAWPLGR